MLERLWHWLGWGCGMKVVPGGVQIDCPLCMDEYVEPEVLARPCVGCGHRFRRHTAGRYNGACRDCACTCFVRNQGVPMKPLCLALAAVLALAGAADAQVIVQQQRGLFRNSSTVVVGGGGVAAPGAAAVVNSQRGLFRGSSSVVVGGAYGGATFAQRSFIPAHAHHQRAVALAPVQTYYHQRAVVAAPVQTYYQQRVALTLAAPSYSIQQRAVYAAPPVVQQSFAAPAPCPPKTYVPPSFAPSYAPAPCAPAQQQMQYFAPQYAPAPAPGCGCCGGTAGGTTYAPAGAAMLQRFGVQGGY